MRSRKVEPLAETAEIGALLDAAPGPRPSCDAPSATRRSRGRMLGATALALGGPWLPGALPQLGHRALRAIAWLVWPGPRV